MSLRHATLYFCIPSCFSLRSYHDISVVAFFYLLMDSSQKKKFAEKYWMEWNSNGDACRCRSHGLDPHNATVISNYYASYPKNGLDEMLRSPKLLGLLLRGKMKKKFLSGNFFGRCQDNKS